MILTIEAARELVISACVEGGKFDRNSAMIIADHLLDCELRGLSFGGLARAISVIERAQATNSTLRPIALVKETPVSATIDGGDNVGYLVAQRATEIAIEKARAAGIAVVGAYETWYTGMFSYYLEQVTAAGFMGMIAGSGGHIVAPEGGTEPRFGTNPIAFGFPSATSPIIWDIGTSEIMLGEVLLRMRLGQSLPSGVAYDKSGAPTTDPASALQGAFTTWGGHKGSGLAMVVQLLGMMCGAAAAPEGLRDCGFFLIVVDPKTLTSADDFYQRASEYAEMLRSTRPVISEKPVRVPFDRSIAERKNRQQSGQLEISDQVHEALTHLSNRR